jgi:hypothetical protein
MFRRRSGKRKPRNREGSGQRLWNVRASSTPVSASSSSSAPSARSRMMAKLSVCRSICAESSTRRVVLSQSRAATARLSPPTLDGVCAHPFYCCAGTRPNHYGLAYGHCPIHQTRPQEKSPGQMLLRALQSRSRGSKTRQVETRPQVAERLAPGRADVGHVGEPRLGVFRCKHVAIPREIDE